MGDGQEVAVVDPVSEDAPVAVATPSWWWSRHARPLEIRAIIEAKAKKVVLNGETYPEYEDWQMVGQSLQSPSAPMMRFPWRSRGSRGLRRGPNSLTVRGA